MFEAPIITAPRYEDYVTKEMISKANLYRMTEAKDIENKMATDFEAMLYIHTVSFEHPLSHSWFKIYLNTFAKYYDVKEILGENTLEELHENESDRLQRLKSWIYKRQLDYLKRK